MNFGRAFPALSAFALVASSSVCLLSASAWAEGAGVRGGGEMVNYQRHPRLRDAVDATACEWVDTVRFVNGNASFRGMLASLRDIHWYLADVIAREASNLHLCLTTQLRRVPTQDEDTVSWVDFRRKQAAVRIGDTIYLDRQIFAELPPRDQAGLLVHEISHSFLELDIPARNDKLRSFVHAIYQHDENPASITAEDLARNMTMNLVQVIAASTPLDGVRAEVGTLLSAFAPEAARLKALQRIGTALVQSSFWKGDQELVAQFADPIYAEARRAVESNSLPAVRAVLLRGVHPLFAYCGKSMLSIASRGGSQDVVAMLVGASEGYSGGADLSSGVDDIVFQILNGRVESQLINRLLVDGLNPNAVGYVNDVSATNPRLVTMLSAAIIAGRFDIARQLVALPGIAPDTWLDAMLDLIATPGNDSTAMAASALDSGAVGTGSRLPDGQTILSECVLRANAQIFDAVLARGVDVNEVNAMGHTAFEVAVDQRSSDFAAKLSAASMFQYSFRETGDVAADHERAKWVLKTFVELNLPGATAKLLSEHHFGWFDLYPLAEEASLNQFTEVARLLRNSMKR